MITLQDFFTDPGTGERRDLKYAAELTPEMRANAQKTVDLWNFMLALYYADRPSAEKVKCASGWRPKSVNAATPGAAEKSTHMDCNAIDGTDESRGLARWIFLNQERVKKIGLYFEDFRATGESTPWVHGQRVPVPSGRLIYIPSKAWGQQLKDTLSLDDLA